MGPIALRKRGSKQRAQERVAQIVAERKRLWGASESYAREVDGKGARPGQPFSPPPPPPLVLATPTRPVPRTRERFDSLSTLAGALRARRRTSEASSEVRLQTSGRVARTQL